jgi:hypothetical protein
MSKSRFLARMLTVCGLASLSLTPWPAQAQIQTVGSLKVFDANGKKLGKVLDVPFGQRGAPVMAMKGNGIPFAVVVINNTPFPFFGLIDTLYFTVGGCGGAAYGDSGQVAGPMGMAFIDGPNFTVLNADPKAVPAMIDVASLKTQFGPCQPTSFSTLAVPVASAGDLSPQFTPPFTVK